MKYQIRFVHTIEHYYTATVEANSKKEAKEKFDADPFEYVDKTQEPDEQEIELEIEDIDELSE